MLKFLILLPLFLISSSSAADTCPYPCNGHPETAYYAKNPRGCAWFFTCNVGQAPKENRCPDGFLFNHQKQLCDFPENVQCNEAEVRTKCPEVGITKIPHPDTCSKFILCVQGEEQDRDCRLGTHFSVFDNDCVSPDRAACKIDRDFCSRNREEDSGIFPQIPNARDCGSYYVCTEDDWVISRQCYDKWHFNPVTGQCEDSETAGCEADQQDRNENIPDATSFDCTGALDGSAHPHPDSCNFFYFCVGGRSFLQMCGIGTKFDVDKRICMVYSGAVCSTDLRNNKKAQVQQLIRNIGGRIRSQL